MNVSSLEDYSLSLEPHRALVDHGMSFSESFLMVDVGDVLADGLIAKVGWGDFTHPRCWG